jgi:hypothetical protein
MTGKSCNAGDSQDSQLAHMVVAAEDGIENDICHGTSEECLLKDFVHRLLRLPVEILPGPGNGRRLKDLPSPPCCANEVSVVRIVRAIASNLGGSRF